MEEDTRGTYSEELYMFMLFTVWDLIVLACFIVLVVISGCCYVVYCYEELHEFLVVVVVLSVNC